MHSVMAENFTIQADVVPSDDAVWLVGSRPQHVLIRSNSISSSSFITDALLAELFRAVVIPHLLMFATLLVELFRAVVIPCLLMFASSLLWSRYNTQLCDPSSNKPLPPGDYGLPLIGETLNLLFTGYKFFDKRRKKHGNIFKTHILGKPTVRVIGSQNVKQILRGENTLVATQWPRSTCILLGEGCISHATGSAHAAKKKALMRTFSYAALSSYVPVVQEITRKYVQKWCDQRKIMGCNEFKKMNFDVSSRVLVGFEMSDGELEKLMEVFETFLSNLFCLPFNIPGLGLWKGLQARQKIFEKLESVIRMKQSKEYPDDSALVNFLLNNDEKEKLTLEEIKNLCLELLFAGHETTSSAACTLVLHLAKHSDIVRKVKEELETFGLESPGCGNDLDFQLLNKMAYVTNVVREALRLVPPVGAGFRRALKTFEIEGYQIPKGWCVTYGIRDTHETSDMFENVDEFDPDRWSHSSGYSSSNFEYLPFGGGRRACAGKDLALLMLKIFTVELVRCSSWTVTNPDVPFSTFPVPYPKDDLPCVFRAADSPNSVKNVSST